ncbi:hypothetical protein V499_05522 [Pseudogymnoascus sp. VKM F-103]|uniref:protein disulfide-isomerase n=1 Tax=Pseudogymnoascus verrucosus TaxID=342668 RepID=A0A1B8GQE7_9PEZI|nr:uncharacterized protein VE01_04029 [Pseudogymnoascus verrucosus]KFY74443.1 hypothetical protein V499_05522 [Pseudogymnoascus sp. VKM F-103]OBT98030.1 hypothetical protein VE01_04029 [Pseudogymnoascus verrucosus]
MVYTGALAAAATALLLASPATAAGLYPKSSAVLQVDAKNYDRLIAKSNYTSIVEFYAPWCGHCKSLQPAYENAAKKLAGLAKVAAVNCDEDINKQFCGSMGVQGFPTLKIVKPGKKFGKPIVEDYQGAREAKPIVEAVSAKIANHVSKVTDKELDAFMAENVDTHKAILFTEKGSTSSLLKAIAIDFLGGIKVAQIRSKEARAVEMFSVEKFPTIVLLPAGNGASATTYDGELKKDDIVKFLSSVHPPNPDPAPAKGKAAKEKKTEKKSEKKSEKKAEKKAAKKAEEEFEEASSSQKESEASASETAEASEEASEPTESPSAEAEKPVVLTPPIPVITSETELADACLTPKSGTCVLAFTSAKGGDVSVQSIEGLAEVAFKYHNSKHAIFPFYAVAEEVTGMPELKAALGLTNDVDVVAINAKRGWMRKYSGDVYTHEAIEMWIDSIRMGEGEKQVLPGILIGKTPEQVAQTTTIQVEETEPKETVSVKDEL